MKLYFKKPNGYSAAKYEKILRRGRLKRKQTADAACTKGGVLYGEKEKVSIYE